MEQIRLNKIVILMVVIIISVLFLTIIRQFLMTLFLAGLFSAMAQPLFKRLRKKFGGRENLASFTTLLIIIMVFMLPLAGIVGIITAQAIRIGSLATPWIQQNLGAGANTGPLLLDLPFFKSIQPYKETAMQKAGEVVSSVSNWLANSLSDATLSTVNFMFLLFIFIYIMFYFLKDGKKLLNKILYYLPLGNRDEQRMLEKFTSVTRATIKGTLVICFLQGVLTGLAFWVVGIEGAVFWGTIIAVLSIIPAIGSGLIWVPATIILAVSGEYVKAAGLAIFCMLIVGSMDNFLRPILVGRDTKMHDLLILLSTLGGISMFGVIGFIIGPITAAVFVTAWDIYGETFREYLPLVAGKKETQEETGNKFSV